MGDHRVVDRHQRVWLAATSRGCARRWQLLLLVVVAASCTSSGGNDQTVATDDTPEQSAAAEPNSDDSSSPQDQSGSPAEQSAAEPGEPDPQITAAQITAGGEGIDFTYVAVDPDPAPGDGCCLDEVTVADVDGDGSPDIVTGAENADGLNWYRNPGAGVIAGDWALFSIGSGDFTTDAEASDLDGDGDIDVVASAISRDVIEWWEQIGDPTSPDGWVRHDIGSTFAHDVVIADLDGDGDLDVATFHKDASRVDWFEQPTEPTAEWTHHHIDDVDGEGLDAGDIDGDGDIDIVAGPAVYTNDGTGTGWSRDRIVDDWPDQARPIMADVDADGTADIVLAIPEDAGRLSWFSGPDWVEHEVDADMGYTHSLEVADIDGDGHVDIFAGGMHLADTSDVTVFFGDGGLSWTPKVLADTGTHNGRLADLDGNGSLDVIGKNFDGPKSIDAWYSQVSVQSQAPVGGDSPLEGFQYVEVDDDRGTFAGQIAFFGLGFGDVDGDGRDDIVSGGYAYSNPGADLSQPWDRVDLGEQVGADVDAMLVTDVDGDEFGDIIATSLPNVWWIESDGSGAWNGKVVASVPATGRPNGQGYRMGDLTGDGRPEIVLSGGPGESEVWYVEIPGDPDTAEWPTTRVTDMATDEQVGIGDIDGDGDADIAAGDMKGDGSYIAWFENPGDGSNDWMRHRLGEFPGVYPDRLDVADIDGDGRIDVIVTEENGGDSPDAEVMWYRQPSDPTSSDWDRSVVVAQYTTNGLDVADIDGDGDTDLVTGEHRGSKRVAVWENTGSADGDVTWVEHPVDEGKESHLGARLWDLDADGDLEIVSIGFDDPTRLHVWINS